MVCRMHRIGAWQAARVVADGILAYSLKLPLKYVFGGLTLS